MHAMIQNDHEKEWMLPLLDLRNQLDVHDDRPLRDFRRMNGRVMEMGQGDDRRVVHGPYTQESRQKWLERLLEAQAWIRANGPEHLRDLELISLPELHEIRRIWVFEKHEIEDSLPGIYEEKTGDPFPGRPLDEHLALASDDIDELRALCGDNDLHFEMTRSLIAVERRFRSRARRNGLFEALEKEIRRAFYEDQEDAVERSRLASEAREYEKGRRVEIDLNPGDDVILLADENEPEEAFDAIP